MMDSSAQGHWTPLIEYANQKGVSMSTLRRYIKAGKIEYRVEHGRYLVWMDQTDQKPRHASPQPKNTHDQIKLLESNLQKAHEEIAEMKMLIALYEEKIAAPQSVR